MLVISIKVPNWFPTKFDLKRYKRYLTMWIFPPRCVDCGVKVKTTTFYWKQPREGTHPMGMQHTLSDFAIRVNRNSCAPCMKKYLHTLPVEMGNCTICETKNVPVLGYRYIKHSKTFITFVWHWWNGSNFCLNCVDELLNNGTVATDSYRVKVKNGDRLLIPEYY